MHWDPPDEANPLHRPMFAMDLTRLWAIALPLSAPTRVQVQITAELLFLRNP
jgi:hypothetical protein